MGSVEPELWTHCRFLAARLSLFKCDFPGRRVEFPILITSAPEGGITALRHQPMVRRRKAPAGVLLQNIDRSSWWL